MEVTGLVCFLAYPALIVLAAVVVSYYRYVLQTCPSLIENWAKQNGFRDLDFQWFGPSPFLKRIVTASPFSGTQQSASYAVIVYRISAVDSDGRRQKGRAFCREWWVWRNVQDPIIEWDPEPSPPPSPTPPKKPERSLLWDRDLDG